MFGKSSTLALAVATAGLIGITAPMASAATTPGGDGGGLVNFSHNNVPVQLCNDYVPVNVIGVQVPADGLAGALGLLNRGNTVARSDTSCHQKATSADNNARTAVYHVMSTPVSDTGCPTSCGAGTAGGPAPTTVIVNHDGSRGDWGGLVNFSNNSIPVQACNITVPVNGIGVQVPIQHLAGGIGVLSPGNTAGADDSSCHSSTSQANDNG